MSRCCAEVDQLQLVASSQQASHSLDRHYVHRSRCHTSSRPVDSSSMTLSLAVTTCVSCHPVQGAHRKEQGVLSDARLSAQAFLGGDAFACEDAGSCDGLDSFSDAASQCSDSSQQPRAEYDEDDLEASDEDDFSYEMDDPCEEEDIDGASSGSFDSEEFRFSPVSTAGRQKIQSWSLEEAELEDLYRKKLEAISDQTCLALEHAGMLLRRFKWNTEVALEEFYNREDEMHKWLGLDKAGVSTGTSQRCGICLEDCKVAVHAACNEHRFCEDCWAGYINSAISSGTDCLSLRCPAREDDGATFCPAAVWDSMILRLASPPMQALFTRRRLQSMVEADRKLKWCPAPGCSFAVQIDSAPTSAVEVCCLAGHASCWSCGCEPHAPVECEVAGQWNKRVSSEGEDLSLTLELIKECPNCHVPIEKVGGCHEVTCQCQHTFCWECLGSLGGDSHECAKEQSDGPDLAQLKGGQRYLTGFSDGFGVALVHWLECEMTEKRVLAAMADLQGEVCAVSHLDGTELSSVLSSFEHLAKFWHQLKWRGVLAWSMSGQEVTDFIHQQLCRAKARLEEYHDLALSGVHRIKNGGAKNAESGAADIKMWLRQLNSLEAETRTYFSTV